MSDYHRIVGELVAELSAIPHLVSTIRSEAVRDREGGHYEVFNVGWLHGRRVHGCSLHIDIIDGKIWIQHDGTDAIVAELRMEAGIPPEHIVLAFQTPDTRRLTQFAQG